MADDVRTGGELDRLKYEVAQEIGYFPARINRPAPRNQREFTAAIDDYKYEVAQELGIPLQHGYNGELTARQAGAIGGRIGGPLGGQMVRRMVQFAEQHLTRGGRLP